MKISNSKSSNPGDLTTDALFNGKVRVFQARSGYRFSIDAVLLAWHAQSRQAETILDLGTGCGIIPLILAYRNPNVKIFAIEVQKDLADIARLNIEENRFEDRIEIICGDLKCLDRHMTEGPVDLVVSNPPYRKAHSGKINPNRQKAIARHEIRADLGDIFDVTGRMLEISGRCAMVYPAERLPDMLIQMRSFRIEPKYLRTVHSRANAEAKLVLVEGMKGARPGVKIGPPLVIYREDGEYSDEVERMYRD